jgi:hypothetical protein
VDVAGPDVGSGLGLTPAGTGWVVAGAVVRGTPQAAAVRTRMANANRTAGDGRAVIIFTEAFAA